MKREPNQRYRSVSRLAAAAGTVLLVGGSLYASSCASSASSGGGDMTSATTSSMSKTPADPDPRIGLKAGTVMPFPKDTTKRVVATPAAETAWNLRLISNSTPPDQFRGVTNSDLAFRDNYAIQGNYNGYIVWDIANPRKPTVKTFYYCPASQSDVSVYGKLLFVSSEGLTGRLDCGAQGVAEAVSQHRMRGIRIFDGTDIANPKYLANVQTCRGSHTHTVVRDLNDPNNVYVYVSGSAGVRPAEELAGCLDAPIDDPNSAKFRIEVIQIPLANPSAAKIVSSPRIFNDLAPVTAHAPPPSDTVGLGARRAAQAASGRGGGRGNQPPTGPTQCHDITVYPDAGLAGGACGGYGLLLDIRDVKNPVRLFAASDSNFSFWHSATFSNDAKKILFTDEWGGGSAPRCRATDKYEWGGDALFTIENGKLVFHSYFKMPAAQTTLENCVAHNGSLIPIPGREVMVQGWYQGGISIFDWTDIKNPVEIAFHDRGPLDADRMRSAGSWSVYWYNGNIVSSEIARGLDVFELLPSAWISKNEIDAAKTVKMTYLNAQEQPRFTWPPSFALARAYLDQLERNNGQAADRIAAARSDLARAEKQSGAKRRDALNALATRMHGEANSATDAPKAHMAASAVGELAKQ